MHIKKIFVLLGCQVLIISSLMSMSIMNSNGDDFTSSLNYVEDFFEIHTMKAQKHSQHPLIIAVAANDVQLVEECLKRSINLDHVVLVKNEETTLKSLIESWQGISPVTDEKIDPEILKLLQLNNN